MTKVCIVSGFLGAGKTTFIKELIEKVFNTGKVVLIENEFGEVAVDSRFMQNSGIEVTEMNSGCICCTLVGDFSRSLKEVVEKYQPDRVIIEPSGVGKLSDVAAAVEDLKDEIEIVVDSKITVVDGKKARLFMKNFGEFFNNQIESATTIVVSRTQLMNDARKQECLALLKEKNSEATIITTPWDQLSGEMILSALEHDRNLEKELMEAHHHGHEHEHKHGHEHHHHEHEHDAHCNCEQEHHHHHHDEHCDHKHEHHEHHEHSEHEHGHHEHKHEHHDEHDHEHHHTEHEKHHHQDHHNDHCPHEHEHHHHHHDEHCSCGHDHHHDHNHDHHHADEVFSSWGIETVKTFNREALKATLEALNHQDQGKTILRAKGILEGDDGQWFEFDMVPEEVEVRLCDPDYIGRLCIIGTELNTDQLKEMFEGDA